jgi:hypothetical protein
MKTVTIGLAPNRIVEVSGILTINGDKRHIPQINAMLFVLLPGFLTKATRLA